MIRQVVKHAVPPVVSVDDLSPGFGQILIAVDKKGTGMDNVYFLMSNKVTEEPIFPNSEDRKYYWKQINLNQYYSYPRTFEGALTFALREFEAVYLVDNADLVDLLKEIS